MAFLSGFGAMNGPYEFWFQSTAHVSDDELRSVQMQIDRLKEELKRKTAVLDKKHAVLRSSSASGSPRGWLSTMTSRVMGNDSEAEIENLVNETSASQYLLDGLHAEYQHKRRMQEKSKFSRTLTGKLFDLSMGVFATYCVYKVFMTTVNTLFSRVSKKDPITTSLEWAAVFINLNIDIHILSQNLSFVMVGIIIASNIRGVMQRMARAFSFLGPSSVLSSAAILICAEVMGMYFVSFIILVRMSLPSAYREIVTQVAWLLAPLIFAVRAWSR